MKKFGKISMKKNERTLFFGTYKPLLLASFFSATLSLCPHAYPHKPDDAPALPHGQTHTPHQSTTTEGTATATPGWAHASRAITIFNNTAQTIIARYQRPDPGFLGVHVLVSEEATLEPYTLHHCRILKNPDHTSICQFTQGNHTLTSIITAHNIHLALALDSAGTLQATPEQAPEA